MDKHFLNKIGYVDKIEQRLNNRDEEKSMVSDEKSIVSDLFVSFNSEIIDNESYEAFFKLLEIEKEKQLDQIRNQQPDLESYESLLKVSQEKAALSGSFRPVDLFINNASELGQRYVLDIICQDCIIDAKSNLPWFLNQQQRVVVLKRMISENTLSNRVDDKLPETDVFGNLLRQIVREGDNLQTDTLNRNDLITLVHVLETILDVGLAIPNILQIKSKLDSNSLLANYALLAANFVGRDIELNKVFNFIRESSYSIKESRNNWTGLVLTGLGGVGKSTLLAKVTEQVLSRQLASVAILDFDRPGIDPRDTPWLEREITSQLLKQYSGIINEYEYENFYESSYQQGNYGSESFTESSRGSRGIIFNLRGIIKHKPFLLILDTLEEATQRSLINSLEEWLSNLCEILQPENLSPIPLKVIFSGRLFDEQLEHVKAIAKIREFIELEDFDVQVAVSFLRQKGLTEGVAQRIVTSNMLPRRPLELKFVAQLIASGTTTLEELETDLREGKSSTSTDQLSMALVYQRVLRRIGDDEMAEIAYPGLTLRYLTAELIQEVLQPALNLEPISAARATELVNGIAGFKWLAYLDSNKKVWHRKDLRRSMLRLMIASEPTKVQKIREKAIKYFETKNTEQAQAEIVYHRLMTMDAKENTFTLEKLRKAYKFIETSIEDLPRPAAILLKFAFNGDVAESEIQLLPDKYFAAAYALVLPKLVTSREFYKALVLYKRVNSDQTTPLNQTSDELAKAEQELLFSTANWKLFHQKPTFQIQKAERPDPKFIENYLFPVGLVEPSLLAEAQIDYLLGDYGSLYRRIDLTKADNITSLNRLAYCLVNVWSQSKLRSSVSLQTIVSIQENQPRLIATEKSFLILHHITKQLPPTSYQLGVPLLKFDRAWLTELKQHVGPQDQNLVDSIAKIFRRTDGPFYTCRTLLNTVDGLSDRKAWDKTQLDIRSLEPQLIYGLVQGPDPLFRDPCRYAILEAFPNRQARLKLAEIIQSVIHIPLIDLQPDTFADMLESNAELALEPVIEIIDRSWAMKEFLQYAAKQAPKSKKLQEVSRAYQLFHYNFQKLLRVYNT